MTALPSIVFGLMLLSIFLLGVLTLRLAGRSRHQRTSIEQLNEALKRSREYAEQQKAKLAQRSDLDTVKDEFISTVSHELRTPLTSIRGALGLLSAGLLGNVDAKAQNLLRIASTNTERLIRLINDILDLERMDSGRAPLKLRRCSMFDLAREAVDTMTTMADGAGVRLELVCNAPRDAIYFDAEFGPHFAGDDEPAVERDQVFTCGLDRLGADRRRCQLAAAEGGGRGARDSGGQAGGGV
jgi:signal transduction histidine kinase